ncbi:hypothetical protein EPR50_G00047410 [Perca flavescens]|uniref:Uncharacterized protein n=1 Tax=Perca flavescens TaxID=8167 RepID=A0A484DAF9_PERFV|nr:hypothetical protein EPR50_G00047410 [Perca flavescens]
MITNRMMKSLAPLLEDKMPAPLLKSLTPLLQDKMPAPLLKSLTPLLQENMRGPLLKILPPLLQDKMPAPMLLQKESSLPSVGEIVDRLDDDLLLHHTAGHRDPGPNVHDVYQVAGPKPHLDLLVSLNQYTQPLPGKLRKILMYVQSEESLSQQDPPDIN